MLNTIQCNAMPCNFMQCNAMQCNTIQYNTSKFQLSNSHYYTLNGKLRKIENDMSEANYDLMSSITYILHTPLIFKFKQNSSYTVLFAFSPTDLFIPTPFSASPGSILVMQKVRATTKSLTFPPLSIARYSFMQSSESTGASMERRKIPNLPNGK